MMMTVYALFLYQEGANTDDPGECTEAFFSAHPATLPHGEGESRGLVEVMCAAEVPLDSQEAHAALALEHEEMVLRGFCALTANTWSEEPT
jgi:hypothetical protein